MQNHMYHYYYYYYVHITIKSNLYYILHQFGYQHFVTYNKLIFILTFLLLSKNVVTYNKLIFIPTLLLVSFPSFYYYIFFSMVGAPSTNSPLALSIP